MANKNMVYPVKDIEYAIKIYYSVNYISNEEIKKIFGISESSCYKLKKFTREVEKSNNMPVFVANHVNTKLAYQTWGIDIKELEKNRQKLIDLGLFHQCS